MGVFAVNLNSGGLSLEACLELPGTAAPYPGVVLCHPHPLYGGNMDNNVIVAVNRALIRVGIAALRFNFRGVGRSQGLFDNGRGETGDAGIAIEFLACHEKINPDRIGVMGYSFGGMVAMAAAASSEAARAVALVSPVVEPSALGNCLKPKYIICGDMDSIISCNRILTEAAGMAGPGKVEVMSGADHFWWGCADRMADKVAAFFREIFER